MKFRNFLLMLVLCGAFCCGAADSNAGAAAAGSAAPAAAAENAGNANAKNGTADKAKPAKSNKGGWSNIIIMVVLFGGVIFLFNRANKKQQRQRQEMMDKVVKGSKVLLNSGVYGKIVEVKENDFLVEIAENVRVLVVKEGIARIEDEKKEEKK